MIVQWLFILLQYRHTPKSVADARVNDPSLAMPRLVLVRDHLTSERLAPFVLTSCIKKLNETKALRKEAEGRCEQLKYELSEKESELTQHSRNLEECKSLMEDWSYCRNTNCGAEFKCYFDTKGPAHSPTYILRCTRCRCRHE
ncbi:hypothetical protein F4808DRAFT_30162 [Astrocystis sublimbata]|nr:hypothetical protein F4808DRAFT_30162 [Astrocystis sublimbata]